MAALSEEQSMLQDQARSWASEQAPVTAFRKMRDSGVTERFEAATWQSMIDMGWTGIIVPESYGGSDLGYLTFGVVLEELGKQLTASPLFASALVGASALVIGGNGAQKDAWLPRIVDGSSILTLAVDDGPRHNPANISTTAKAAAGGFNLSGTKTMVLEGMAATDFIVAARTSGHPGEPSGITLFVVPADSSGLSRTTLSMVDSRGYARVSLDSVSVTPEQVLGGVDNGFDLLEQILDRGRAGLGAEMMGTASTAFDMTLEYLKTREQFGRVIGSFQALGHRAAELYGNMEMSRSCAEAALIAIDNDASDISELCSLSKAKVGDFVHVMSNQLIQILGGIGMTDEFDAGFYLKRARALEAIFGNQAFHKDRYARSLGF